MGPNKRWQLRILPERRGVSKLNIGKLLNSNISSSSCSSRCGGTARGTGVQDGAKNDFSEHGLGQEKSLANSIRDVLLGFVGGGLRSGADAGDACGADFSHTGLRGRVTDTTVPSPRDSVDVGGLDVLEAAFSSARNVSFNNVVKQVVIESRQQLYSDAATKREAFYTQAEVAVFKKNWQCHLQTCDWSKDGLMRCGCSRCENGEEGMEGVAPPVEDPVHIDSVVDQDEDDKPLESFSRWVWEG